MRNDRAAQKVIYDCFEGRMRAVCIRYCRSREDAEDMLQTGFLHVFEKIQQFQFKGSFEGWMRKVFIGTSINYLRSKEYKAFSKLSPLDSVRISQIDDYLEDSNSYNINELDEINDEFDMNDLIEMLNRLPVGCGTVFNLYVIDELSHKEIASLLNISEGTSKSQLFNARKILRKEIIQRIHEKKTNNPEVQQGLLRIVI
ncbi:MAG: sigma-70 family RNA polymerase sigma factor [Bacteroidales bacterium]|nr:sigma-70 family RNA polymerase sigma factor [Bacteroidales bacterium]